MIEHFIQYSKYPDWWVAILFLAPLAVSAIFFLKDKNKKLWKRFSVSAHGAVPILVVILCWLATVPGWVENGWALFLGLMPPALIFFLMFSFFNFLGNKKLQFLHIFTLGFALQLALYADTLAKRVFFEGKPIIIYEGHPFPEGIGLEDFETVVFLAPALLAFVFVIFKRRATKLKIR